MGCFSTFPTYFGFGGGWGGRVRGPSPAGSAPSRAPAALAETAWPFALYPKTGRPAAPASCGVGVLAGGGEEAAPSLSDPGPRFSPIYKARPIARPRLVLCFALHQAQELLFACLDFGTLQLLGLEIVRLRRERFTVDLYTAAIDESPCF